MASQWRYARGQQQLGSVSLEQLRDLARSGQLAPDDMVWTDGFPAWVPASQASELQDAFPAASPLDALAAAAASPAVVGYQQPHTDAVVAGVRALDLLRQTKPWVRFMGIMCFVGAGLMVLAGLFLMLAGAMAPGRGTANAIIGLIYIPFGLLGIVPGVYLNRYASSIAQLLQFRRGGDLEAALEAQKSYWKFVGILAIIMLALYVIFLCVAFALGASLAARGGRF